MRHHFHMHWKSQKKCVTCVITTLAVLRPPQPPAREQGQEVGAGVSGGPREALHEPGPAASSGTCAASRFPTDPLPLFLQLCRPRLPSPTLASERTRDPAADAGALGDGQPHLGGVRPYRTTQWRETRSVWRCSLPHLAPLLLDHYPRAGKRTREITWKFLVRRPQILHTGPPAMMTSLLIFTT